MRRFIPRTRVLAVLVLGVLSIVCGGAYLLVRPMDGIGGSFDTPQAAVTEALGPTGWLDGVDRLILHDSATTAEGQLFVYTGYPLGTPTSADPPSVFGLVDAKPSLRGWYAHGMIGVHQPPSLSETAFLTYTTTRNPSLGKRWLVISGYARQSAVAYVEVRFDTGFTKHVAVHSGSFAALAPDTNHLIQLRAFDQQGNVLETIAIASQT